MGPESCAYKSVQCDLLWTILLIPIIVLFQLLNCVILWNVGSINFVNLWTHRLFCYIFLYFYVEIYNIFIWHTENWEYTCCSYSQELFFIIAGNKGYSFKLIFYILRYYPSVLLTEYTMLCAVLWKEIVHES